MCVVLVMLCVWLFLYFIMRKLVWIVLCMVVYMFVLILVVSGCSVLVCVLGWCFFF